MLVNAKIKENARRILCALQDTARFPLTIVLARGYLAEGKPWPDSSLRRNFQEMREQKTLRVFII